MQSREPHPLRGLSGLQIEDVALFVWFALGEPLVERALRRVLPADLPAALEAGGSPLLGLTLLAAAAAAAVCLATRDPSQTSWVGEEGWMTPANYARLPMLVVLAMLVEEGFEQLGSDAGERLFAWVVVFVGGTLLLQPWLPAAPYLLRRVLMLPAVAVGAVTFSGFIESAFGGLDLSILARGGPQTELAGAQFGTVIVVLGSLLYYVLYVFAPRQVASPSGSWLGWLGRYLFFLAAFLTSLIWGTPGPAMP